MRKLATALLCCLAFHAQADLSSATEAFNAKNYEKALPEITTLAQRGIKEAQFMLAQMYEQGLGIDSDVTLAHAWYTIAKENNYAAATDKYAELRKQLPNRREAKTVWQELDQKYGAKAFDKNLAPVDRKFSYHAGRATLVEKVEPEYPSALLASDISAWSIVRYDVNESGMVDDIEVLASYPRGQLDEYISAAMKQWRYKNPLNSNGEPSRVNDLVTVFKIESKNRKGRRQYEKEIGDYFAKLLSLAEEGNHVAQFRVALMLEHDQVKTPTEHSVLDWYVAAAQNGNENAQLRIAHCLYSGEGCETDRVKALNWLRFSADNNNTRAQFLLGKILINSDFEYANQTEAAEWLRKAAHKQYMPAVSEYARLLAFSDDSNVRNMTEAVKYAELARSIDPENPTLLSVIGAAYAEFGKTQEAQQLLEQAVQEASRRHWPTRTYLELLEDNKASMLAIGM